MKKQNTLFLLSLLITTFFMSAISHAKPFCALRDPVHEVYSLLPTANSYKSIVHLIDKQARKEILETLPFTIHSKEIGQHTVYVGQDAEVPVGVVHVRSEPGNWGLLEIAWALDLDGKIIDFRFQRCREKGCDEIQNEKFRKQLAGMELKDLSALLNEDGSFKTNKFDVSTDSSELIEAVLRSAMKTIVITDLIWGKDIEALKETSLSMN